MRIMLRAALKMIFTAKLKAESRCLKPLATLFA